MFDFSHVYHILLHTHTYTHFQYFKILKIWVATCLYVLVCVGSCSSNLIRLREYKTSVKDKYKTSEVCVWHRANMIENPSCIGFCVCVCVCARVERERARERERETERDRERERHTHIQILSHLIDPKFESTTYGFTGDINLFHRERERAHTPPLTQVSQSSS